LKGNGTLSRGEVCQKKNHIATPLNKGSNWQRPFSSRDNLLLADRVFASWLHA